MLDTINTALTTIDDFIWGLPLIIAILAVGLFMTFRLKGLQVTKFPLAVKELFSNERSGEDGEVSSFAALCTALSATIGTGNIVGVATAMVAGGPGALFWMWIAAIVEHRQHPVHHGVRTEARAGGTRHPDIANRRPADSRQHHGAHQGRAAGASLRALRLYRSYRGGL